MPPAYIKQPKPSKLCLKLLLLNILLMVSPSAEAAASSSFRLYTDSPNYASSGPARATNFGLNENGATWSAKPGISSNFQLVSAPPRPPEPVPVTNSSASSGGDQGGGGRRPCGDGGFGCRNAIINPEPTPSPTPTPAPASQPAGLTSSPTHAAAPPAGRPSRRRSPARRPLLAFDPSQGNQLTLPTPYHKSLSFGRVLRQLCPNLLLYQAAPADPTAAPTTTRYRFPWLLLILLIIALICTTTALICLLRTTNDQSLKTPKPKPSPKTKPAEDKQKIQAREIAREQKWEQEWEKKWEKEKALAKKKELKRRRQALKEAQAKAAAEKRAQAAAKKQAAALAKQKKKKKRRLRIQFAIDFVIIAFAVISLSPSAQALTTGPLTNVYNGHLLNSAGEAITTAHTIRFSYWNTIDFVDGHLTSTGAINTNTGAYIGWYEEHTVTPDSEGYFSVTLGSINPLPNLSTMSTSTLANLFLQEEVKVAGAADSAYELLDHDTGSGAIDRSAVLSVPFARNADLLDQRDTGTASGAIPVLGSGGKLSLESPSASGKMVLEFGSTLGKQLSYDQISQQFNFNAPLKIEGGVTVGNVALGSGTGAGTLRWNGSDFEGYDGTSWLNFGVGGSTFIGTTTATTSGSFATGSLIGYQAGNAYCNAQFTNSHMCQMDEIITTISANLSSFSGASNAWVAEGAPGFTSKSNDCLGWTNHETSQLGAWWEFSEDGGLNTTAGGGKGFLTNCAVVQPIACCR